jgi:hypothetical protein
MTDTEADSLAARQVLEAMQPVQTAVFHWNAPSADRIGLAAALDRVAMWLRRRAAQQDKHLIKAFEREGARQVRAGSAAEYKKLEKMIKKAGVKK